MVLIFQQGHLVVLAIVLVAMASSDLQFLKLLGVGLTVAVVVDATLYEACSSRR